MASIPVELRDSLITNFRNTICIKMEIIPFPHQAQWWAASDGMYLTDSPAGGGDMAMQVQVGKDEYAYWRLLPRPEGRARVIADLGSFKSGKSFGSGIWASAFAAVPNARVQIIGLEYDTCSPEFEYIVEALLSERGMGLKYSSLQNRPRDGRMYLDLPNGARFEARSWERKDSLKGKEIDCYLYAEAYQLPGLESYTDFSQNLQKRSGYAVFATTPDRPWVQAFHERGHGDPAFPDWYCICGVTREQNPYTFDKTARDKDDPDKGGLMTREKYAIAWLGQLGSYVGRVYNYQRGQRVFTRGSHPHIWKSDTTTETFADLRLPSHWEIIGGADTGAFTSGLLVGFDEDGNLFVLAEFPNYAYKADGKPEVDEGLTIAGWAAWIRSERAKLHNGTTYWADSNSQWKNELRNHGVHLFGNSTTRETRVSILREYFAQGKIFFAPWLKILPYELENARWPEEASALGKFERIKHNDHTLDPLEHIASKRPRGRLAIEPKSTYGTFIESQMAAQGVKIRKERDQHGL
jgi:hypothetical protein